MVDKIKQEKSFLYEQRNQAADYTFNSGQEILTDLVHKFSRASTRKNKSLDKRSERESMHLSEAKKKHENSIIAEENRVTNAIEKTGYKTHDFLKRISDQQK